MYQQKRFAIIGLFIGAAVDLVINLVASGIQQEAFSDQFSSQAIWGLIIFIIVGLLVGYWLGTPVEVNSSPYNSAPSEGNSLNNEKRVLVTRLHAFGSYVKMRGKGIELSNIISVGSNIDIDTKE